MLRACVRHAAVPQGTLSEREAGEIDAYVVMNPALAVQTIYKQLCGGCLLALLTDRLRGAGSAPPRLGRPSSS